MSSSSPAGPAGGGAGDVCIGGIGCLGIVDVGSGFGPRQLWLWLWLCLGFLPPF